MLNVSRTSRCPSSAPLDNPKNFVCGLRQRARSPGGGMGQGFEKHRSPIYS